MKAFWLGLALSLSSPVIAGGAIGGSTGSKCAEHIILNSLQFQRLIHQALTTGEFIIRGENMQVEVLDLEEQTLQMRSLDNHEHIVLWILEIREWD